MRATMSACAHGRGNDFSVGEQKLVNSNQTQNILYARRFFEKGMCDVAMYNVFWDKVQEAE